jgi:hypothetical protein
VPPSAPASGLVITVSYDPSVAGASAVEVGTASFADPASAERIQRETVGWCRRHGVDAVRTLVGAAHEGAPLVDLEKVPENP